MGISEFLIRTSNKVNGSLKAMVKLTHGELGVSPGKILLSFTQPECSKKMGFLQIIAHIKTASTLSKF
jgi:hypothetical protein